MNSIKKIGNLKVVLRDNKKICIKKVNNYIDREKYLTSKGFLNILHSEIINGYVVRDYIDEVLISKEDKLHELIYLICLLHTKTTHYKNLTIDKIKDFYEDETNKIIELKKYYESIFDRCIYKFLPPSIYLLIKHMSLILKSLDESKIYLDKWYEIVKDKKRKRVVLNHNNLKVNNLIVGEKIYLINWDKSIIDYPIYDVLSLFKSNYKEIDMLDLFNIYKSKYGLLSEEYYLLISKLLRIDCLIFSDNEVENCKSSYNIIYYLKAVNSFLNDNMEKKK